MKTARTPFWLEVKKNYIIENFDNLVQYLRDYSFNPDDISVIEDEKSDFGRTFSTLKELVYDYMKDTEEDCLYTYENKEWGDISFMLRVMCTYLLASKIKKQVDHRVLARIADILLLSENAYTQEANSQIRSIIVGCIKGTEIQKWGFSWSHIIDWDKLSPEVICINVGKTIFKEVDKQTWLHDGCGCVMLADNNIYIAPMNRNAYRSEIKKVVQFSTSPNLEFEIQKANYVSNFNAFSELREKCVELLSSQSSIQPSPRIKLKQYNIDDNIVAKVTDYHAHGVVVESIDTAYKKISGKVYIPTLYSLDPEDFKKNLKVGDLIMVTVQQDKGSFPFKLAPAFGVFMKHYADTCHRETYGIYDSYYNFGHRWYTIDGLFVNVLGEDLPEYAEQAVSTGMPVSIDILDSSIDKKGNPVVSGKYSDEPVEDEIESLEEFRQAAKSNLISSFVDYATDNKPIAKNGIQEPDIEKDYIRYLSHLEYYHASMLSNTRNRYIHLFISRYLANIDSNKKDSDYIAIEMNYQECLVLFASGYPSKLISFEPKEELTGVNSVQWRMNVINRLNGYEEIGKNTILLEFNNLSSEERLSAIEGLIKSSNRLNGKINQPEINRIKKQIARHLSVDDEFVNTISDITYYGEESDTLEFKSSAVFSPEGDGLAETNKQIWTILKTICGFMNTLSGGEILLGVKDSGNSCGLKEDVEYLYKNRKISEPSMDKYRNYIKMNADKAFIDDIGMSTDKEITTGRINYLIERNKENHDILRIQVRPYEYGVVLFNNKRPDYIEQGYIRTSGATMSLTDEMKHQTRERKLNASYDGNLRKFLLLQQACKERKQVQLLRYTSQSGIKDRIVEPYMPLPEHDAFLCFDTSVDKNPIREFKIARIGEVELLNKSWANSQRHKNLNTDIFGMLEDQSSKPYKVKLKLAPLAYNLIKEECKNAEKYLSSNPDASDRGQYPWILETNICKNEGIGRFYIGLANYIKIVEGQKLKEYVKEYVNSYLK